MNVFELSLLATPVAGAIGAGNAAVGKGLLIGGLCSVGGFFVGAAMFAGSMAAMTLVVRATGIAETRKESFFISLAELIALAFPMTSWIWAALLSHWLVQTLI